MMIPTEHPIPWPVNAPRVRVTVITMCLIRPGHTFEIFTSVAERELNEEQMDMWRKAHKCDEYDPRENGVQKTMFFRSLVAVFNNGLGNLVSADGESDETHPFQSDWNRPEKQKPKKKKKSKKGV